MRGLRISGIRKNWLASLALGGFVFLLSPQIVEAAASLTLSTSFQSVDPARANTYMDQAGTWNGTTEVTNGNADIFTLRVANAGAPATDAFDLGITVTLPSGFRLPDIVAPINNPVTVTSPTGCNTNAGVTNFTGLNATQAGATVNFNIPANRNIPLGCTYDFSFRLTTRNAAPFPAAGANNITYAVTYNDGGPTLNTSSAQTVQVNPAVMALTKTALTTSAANGDTVNFRIDIRNTGTGGAFAALLTDTLSANLTGLTFTSFNAFNNTTNAPVAMPTVVVVSATQRRFVYIPPNVRIEVGVQATASVNPTSTTCPVMTNNAQVVQRTTQSSSNFATVDYNLPNSLTLTYDLANSYCELCGVGTIRLTAANTGGIALTNVNVVQDLMASGLTYVPGSTRISLNNPAGAGVVASDPVLSGANNQILTWTPTQIPSLNQLDSPYDTTPTNPVTVTFIFQVHRAVGFTEEGLSTAVRNMEARSSYTLVCGGPTQNASSGIVELPVRQPVPQTIKLGRNTDAGQDAGQYAPIVYGHINDDIIWRVDVQNTGLAGMQDLLIDDTIGGNFDINYVCNSEAAATAAAAGAPPAVSCVSAGGGTRTSVLNFAVDDPFGNPANDQPATFIDSPVAGDAFIYYVGRILGTCTNHTNNTNIEWGCEVNAPDGGLAVPASNGGVVPANTIASAADMSTNVVTAGLDVAVALTGSNVNQPAGTKGLVTITITNLTGGTVRLSNLATDISLSDVLPVQYVMDTTFVPTAVMTPAYGNAYLGMIDTITHLNPAGAPLGNTNPQFNLRSSTSNGIYNNLIRHGDVLTVQFGIVLIDPTRYDYVANLDVAPEVTADGTDPNTVFTVSNSVTVNFRNICTPVNATSTTVNGNYPARPEDLDVDTSSALYILTNNVGVPLPLTVLLTNNGGHDADDYAVYVTFGQAMTVQTAPAGCVATTNPPTGPAHPLWNQPVYLPPTASVYRCYRGVIAPGATENITFQVIKNSGAANDDLTFRADVVGEITLSNGTPLTFPAPVSLANTTPNQQLANNYTLDGIRARVLGFNLTKAQSTTCTEDPPGTVPDLLVRLGEDCDYFIQAGGWFGFDTPGFTLISVQDMLITDDLPNGQGFISSDDGATSDMDNGGTVEIDGLRNITRAPAVLPALTEGDVSWNFNQGAGNALTERDKFFNLNFSSRMLNDALDPLYQPPLPAAPNVHAGISTNIARASFYATYQSGSVTDVFCVSDTANVPVPGCIVPPGFPAEAVRRIDLTVTEPNLIVTKDVCNETLYGTGPACSNFVTLPAVASDGDTQDMYVYRVTITNEATSGGVARAPAFNVIVTDVLDASDLMMIAPGGATPFDTDGLDNDGDGAIDGADANGEFFSLTENVANGGTPATFVISNTHSVPLQRINPGASVTFYYRIDPDDAVSPLQTLSNTVSTLYDSLAGDSGNQHAPQLTNAENTAPNNTGRARIYDALDDTASIQILPLQTQPKAVIQVANSTYTGSPQNAVVGEDVQYRLHAQIPVANLRNFIIRDELPPGIRCVDAQTINLNAGSYAAAGFVPGGIFAATCTSTGTNDVVEWNFGNQELTTATSNNLFDFYATFTARVENSVTTQNACNIRNGGSTGAAAVPAPAACSTDVTLARLTYTNESGSTVTLNYGAADVIVREPVVTVTKSFAPVVNADADDVLLVTVTATNSGTAPAYNLQILDDLTGTNMTYVAASVGGAVPPDNVDIATLGANQPIFNWDNIASAGYELAVGETITFTFQVSVDAVVQPHEILDNTIEARWTSLPSVNTALPDIDTGAARTLAADGDVLGMRNGQLTGVAPASANPPNDYNATATASVVVPQLTIDKTDLNPATVPAIGEHKQFRIVISLPEGISNGVVVTDNLDALAAAGETYVLENASPLVVYSCSGLQQINATTINCATATSADIAAALLAEPIDGATNTVTWNIGTVDTVSENDLPPGVTNPQIIITYYARINNDVATNVGDQLQNGATLTYTNGETAATETRTDNTAAVTVVEPALTVVKVVSNITKPGFAPDAGDVLQYVVTINNTGNATAFDVNVRDNIPATIQRDVSFTATATINTVAVAGFVAVPQNDPAGPLIWGRGNADENLDIPAGGTLVLTYRVVVQNTVEPNQAITNSVVIDWTSLNGANVLERNGGTPLLDCSAVVAPDDYCAGPATSTVTVSNLNNVTKIYNSDSYAPANDAQLRVGDTVQYTVTLSLQEGTTDNLQLVDTLPNGMEFVGVVSVNGDTTVPYSSAGVFTHADIAAPIATTGTGNNTVTWTIGSITNAADNNAANDEFVIVYTAQVVNDELPIPQAASTVLLNSVSMNYLDAANAPVSQLDTASITAQQPILANITKLRRSGIVSGSPVNSGDYMDFRLTACNSGNAPAYDVEIDDTMDAELLAATLRNPGNTSVQPDVYVNGVLQPKDSSTYTYTLTGQNLDFLFHNIAVNPASSAPNNCIVIEFDVQVDPGLGINNSWDNSFQVTQYHSLASTDVNVAERETYGPVGPVVFNMHNIAPIYPPVKTLLTPTAPYEATIGQSVNYQIIVPDTAMNGTLYDVTITDDMDDSLVYVSAVSTHAIATNTSANDQINLVIGSIPATEQATVTINARVANIINAQNTVTPFGNTANYTFADMAGGSPIVGGGDATDPLTNVSIVEPQLTLQSKTVANITNPGNAPDAGDILRYTLTINAAGGAQYSDAFDVSVIDTLGLGLVYSGNPTVSNSGAYTNTIVAPATVGDGVSAAQVMTWNLANGSNIDVTEGGSITITYEVLVLDSVQANQNLTNSAVVQWTSINGADANERDGSGGVNDYFSGPLTTTLTTPNTNNIIKTKTSDTFVAGDDNVRIGDIITYQLDLNLQEGTHNNLLVTDVLPQGVVFEGIVSIHNDTTADYAAAAPFVYADIPAGNITVTGDPMLGATTLNIDMGDVVNSGDNNATNNTLTIVYRARVLNNNAHAQVNNIALTNNASYSYDTATVAATTAADSVTLNLLQPNLAITKTSTQQFGDSIIQAGELITYTVTITNNGTAPAYDTVLRDVIPYGMRIAGVTTTSIESPLGNALATFAPTFNATTGEAIWNFDSGVADAYSIQPGQALRIVYTVYADAGLGAGATLTNSAQVQVYYSFDDEAVPVVGTVTGAREDYGPSNTATVTLTTPAPNPLAKINPVNTNASIGIPFTYRITVPDAPQSTALYDVRILDNLDNLSPNVDLIFVDAQRVSGTQTWTPVNTGTDTDLVIEDTVNGIDIPAGEQIVIDLTVVLRNTSNNVAGDVFQNTASYTFNTTNNDPLTQGAGGGASTANMTIVEPLTMVLDKTGPATMQYGVPGTFTIDVQNTGTGPAYDLTVTDHLPDPVPGGMCDIAPANFTAQTRDAANVLQQTLTAGVDFTTSLTAATTLNGNPTCTLAITMQSANAVMQSGWHLVMTYDAQLDVDNFNGDPLTNIAAATQWFSGDTPAGTAVGEIRTYTQTFDATDPGTPAVIDHQDTYATTVASPELRIEKTVINVATNNPAYTAEPGETLRYTITVTNTGPIAANNFSLSDEMDRLNIAPGYFVANTLANVVVTEPDNVNLVTVNQTGGTHATGLITVSDLDLTAAGGGGDTLSVRFDITLRPVIDSGTIVTNQAQISLTGFSNLLSDDPNLPGATDPTQTIIGSAPTFQVHKTSDDITGNTAVLARGDILVYTLRVKNIGAEHAVNTLLRDQIPANTTYVANTTTLNGASVADPAQGVSPLQDGMLINAPENTTAGYMRAEANVNDTGNVAVITFNVMINADVVNGTVISNQAYVGGEGIGSGAFAEQLSDDPDTDIIGDPTRDIVGNVPILDAQKTVALTGDANSDGVVDPLETLTYTIVINNAGISNATGVVLQDNVPANTTYVADTLLMNGLPVAQPDGGVLPLIAGVDVSSSDLTPPLPASGAGTISAGATVTVTFDVTVNNAVASGTIISNQGEVTSNEYPDELTDADGNDINGDQPTQIVVGATQRLSISKDVFVVGGGRAQPGSTLEYFIHVENTGPTAIDLSTLSGEVLKVMDDVDQGALLTYVAGSARLNGVNDPNIIYSAPRLIVNFDDSKRATATGYQFEPGDSFTVRYLAQIGATAVQGQTITNTAAVDWGTQNFTPVNATTFIRCTGGTANVDACATSTLAVGGAPGVATLSGQVWHDADFDLTHGSAERVLEGWEVQIYFGAGTVNAGDYLDSVFTDVNGDFTITGLISNDSDPKLYALAFRAPGASTDTASLGNADSIYTDGPQQITVFDVMSGSHVVDMNLPIQPNGVAYNAVTRAPVAGAVLELVNAGGVAVPASCFNDPQQQNQRTLADGYYKFELNFSDALCPSVSDYTIRVYPPAGFMDYDSNPATNEVSRIIPPLLPLTDPGYDVPTCSGDALATAQCEVQTSEFAPATSVPPRTPPTNYYLKLNVQNLASDDQLYNNHLPIDPEMSGALAISKTSPMVNVTRSQLVPYTITLSNALGAPVYDINVVDNFPPGFKYVAGSSRIYLNDVRVTNRVEEPDMLAQGAIGRSLTWPDFTVYENDVITFKMLLVVGAGVGEGEYVNLAHAANNLTGGNASGEASATVRVVPDPTFDCSDIIGKVFDDRNLNGYADDGEPGIAGARVATAQGLEATTDEYGRYHFTCATIPNEDRGSNFIVKLDERSLPTGYRVTSENPRTQRATRGKMLKYNFGAAIHHVIRLDMMDAVFKPGTTDIRSQWLPRLDMLITELAKEQSVLRLSYLAENEDESLVNERLQKVKDLISERWEKLNCCYKLMIETEVFWRKGGPVDREEFE
jgi:uncharacterized repeat protein (TIGR01451 family)/fimbrial isopeptide formation D2 family protein